MTHKEKLLIDVFGDYTTLVKTGGKLWGLCPMHAEETPSFYIDAKRNTWHCFGCEKSGEVGTLLDKLDRKTNPRGTNKVGK
jgi:DNA primase